MSRKRNGLNRFVKMMVLQYFRAKKLGFEENLSKAIGYGEALKYAIFKNKAFSRFSNSKNNSKQKIKETINSQINNLQENPIFKLKFTEDNYPFVGDKKITEKDFEIYLWKYQDYQEKLYQWASQIIENIPMELLQKENQFFNKVWKIHRDDEI